MQGNEDVGSEQSAPAGDESVVYESFLAAGLDHRRAFGTTQAIRGPAGPNIAEMLKLHLEKVDLKLDAMRAEIESALGALSDKVDALSDKVDGLIDRTDSLIDRTDSLIDRTDSLINRTGSLINRMDSLIIRMDALMSQLRTHRWLYCVTILLLAILVALKMIMVFQN